MPRSLPKSSRKPDFIIKGLNKVTNERLEHVGAAWENPDGSVSLVFDRFIQLPTGDNTWVWTLFPPKEERGNE